jgi:hypothetical protein
MANIVALPTELIRQIFSTVANFDAPPPSAEKFCEEPSPELTRSTNKPMKALSWVCHRWRDIILPELFKYSRVSLNCDSQWLSLSAELAQHLQCDRSARARDLIREIQATQAHQLITAMPFKYIAPGDEYMQKIPCNHYHWVPSSRGNVDSFLQFIEKYELTSRVKSLVVYTEQEVERYRENIEEVLAVREIATMWRNVFHCIDPERVVIAAPPSTLAALASSREDSMDTWAFEMTLHYLCFSTTSPYEDLLAESTRPLSSASAVSGSASTPPSPTSVVKSPTCILNMRRWRDIAYNEGTMIKGYSHYEYQWKCPPRILPVILLWLSKEPATSPHTPQILSVQYTSLFPYTEHINTIARILSSLPSLRYFDVKLASTKLLDDKMIVGRAQMSDVWSNWKDSYRFIWSCWLRTAPVGTIFRSRDVDEGSHLAASIWKRLPTEEWEQTVVGQRLVKILRRDEEEGTWVRIADANVVGDV